MVLEVFEDWFVLLGTWKEVNKTVHVEAVVACVSDYANQSVSMVELDFFSHDCYFTLAGCSCHHSFWNCSVKLLISRASVLDHRSLLAQIN